MRPPPRSPARSRRAPVSGPRGAGESPVSPPATPWAGYLRAPRAQTRVVLVFGPSGEGLFSARALHPLQGWLPIASASRRDKCTRPSSLGRVSRTSARVQVHGQGLPAGRRACPTSRAKSVVGATSLLGHLEPARSTAMSPSAPPRKCSLVGAGVTGVGRVAGGAGINHQRE